MDIKKWLDETVQPAEQPTLPEQLGFPAFLDPKEKHAVGLSARRVGTQRRPSADSSILRAVAPAAAPFKRTHDHTRRGEDRESSHHASSRAPSAQNEPESDRDSKRYQRKPRRKTRADRYEPKPGKESNGVSKKDSNRKRKTKDDKNPKPSKTRRRDKSAVADVVHNFHANNVSRERLTVCIHFTASSGHSAKKYSCNHEPVQGCLGGGKHPLHSEGVGVSIVSSK